MSSELEKAGGVEAVEHRDDRGFRKTLGLSTGDNDEAAEVIDNYSGEQTWTEQEEKRLRRRIDWKLMPLLCITYGLQYYDKGMLSQAVRLHIAFYQLVFVLELMITCSRSLASSQTWILMSVIAILSPQPYSILASLWVRTQPWC